jgi:hypothetical protein
MKEDDDGLDIPPFLRRPIPEGVTLKEEIARANKVIAGLPGGRWNLPEVKNPQKQEVKRYELSDAEAVKLAQREEKFMQWQTSGRPGAGKKAVVKKRAKSRSHFTRPPRKRSTNRA